MRLRWGGGIESSLRAVLGTDWLYSSNTTRPLTYNHVFNTNERAAACVCARCSHLAVDGNLKEAAGVDGASSSAVSAYAQH
jgi:hypothetical protein